MAKLLFVALTFLSSVSAFAQTPPVNPAQPGAPAAPVLEVSGEVQISEIQSFLKPFVYDREQLRDPFEMQGSSSPLEPGQVYGPFLEMQRHKLSEYSLKGLLWKTDKPVAIFRSPDGVDHRLTIKDYIGENFGYIAMIREREVVVIQTIEEDNRRYSTTKVVFLE